VSGEVCFFSRSEKTKGKVQQEEKTGRFVQVGFASRGDVVGRGYKKGEGKLARTCLRSQERKTGIDIDGERNQTIP